GPDRASTVERRHMPIAVAGAGVQELLACPACHHRLDRTPDEAASCPACPTVYRRVEGHLDFAPRVPRQPAQPATVGLAQLRLRDPATVPRYERVGRPAFLRVMG